MIEIRNCDFKFQCPKTWDSLSLTHKPDVKYCDHCYEEVHFCHTTIELQEAILNNYCVAVVSTVEAADETKRTVLLGDINPSFLSKGEEVVTLDFNQLPIEAKRSGSRILLTTKSTTALK